MKITETNISDAMKIQPFSFLDLAGKDIVGELNLGLPLYRGAVFCGSSYNFNFKAADAICKRMNFTRAEMWTRKSIHEIHGIEDKVLGKMGCSYSLDWDRCNYYEEHDCRDNDYVFLSCSGSICVRQPSFRPEG